MIQTIISYKGTLGEYTLLHTFQLINSRFLRSPTVQVDAKKYILHNTMIRSIRGKSVFERVQRVYQLGLGDGFEENLICSLMKKCGDVFL